MDYYAYGHLYVSLLDADLNPVLLLANYVVSPLLLYGNDKLMYIIMQFLFSYTT